MSDEKTYIRVSQAYADGVRVLFAPSGVEAGERGKRGPASYGDLTHQAERLTPLSTQLTEAVTAQLLEEDPALRIQASTRLLAKALTDFDVSQYLLQAAMDEEDDTEWAEDPTGERSRTGFPLEEQLGILTGKLETGFGVTERGGGPPADIKTARYGLSSAIEDTLASISEQAGNTAQMALNGLLGIGVAQAAEAAGTVGLQIAQVLGQAERVTHLYALVRDFALKAYDSLLGLIGPRLAEVVGQQVLEWLNDLKEGKKTAEILEKLYETEQTGAELDTLTKSSQVELQRFVDAINGVESLEEAYRLQIRLADKVIPKLKYLRLIPAAALPAARLLLAAVYIVLGSYVVLAGADFVDSKRLSKLDRVPGVRQVVKGQLTPKAN